MPFGLQVVAKRYDDFELLDFCGVLEVPGARGRRRDRERERSDLKVGALIVARLSSTRLPAKNMVPILGKPMIQHLIERVGRASGVDLVAIATSTEPSDNPLCEFAEREGVPYHRGSLDNVMERVRTAAETLDCDAVAEILGDNPLVHSDLVDDVVRKFEEDSLDYAASVTNEYPGVDPSLKRFVLGIPRAGLPQGTSRPVVGFSRVPGSRPGHIGVHLLQPGPIQVRLRRCQRPVVDVEPARVQFCGELPEEPQTYPTPVRRAGLRTARTLPFWT